MEPIVSILMSVYNTPSDILDESIDSIIKQTVQNWELIIIDDCSKKKETIECLNAITDSRVHIYTNSTNIGLTKSLIKGIKYCKGIYIARMDADDIALPERLMKQIEYIEKKNFEIIGSYYGVIPERRFVRFITEDLEKQQIRMAFGNAGIVHSSAMWKRESFERKGINYNPKFAKSQDYGMWCECMLHGLALGCCPEKVVLWRESENQITKMFPEEQKNNKTMIRKGYLESAYKIDEYDLNVFVEYIDDLLCLKENIDVKSLQSVLKRYVENNIKKYPSLRKEVYRYWFLQSIIRFKNIKRWDMVLTRFFILCLAPQNLGYILFCLIKEIVIA